MATFVDLTKADTPKTPTRRTLQQEQNTTASKSCHSPLSQRNPNGVINDKVIDGNIDHDRDIHPIPVTPTMTRPPSGTPTEPSPPHNRPLQPMIAHNEDELQIQNRTPTRNRGQGALNSALASRRLDRNGSFDVPFSRSNINAVLPSAKRRCIGLNRSQAIVDLSIDSDSDEELEVIEATLCPRGHLGLEPKQGSSHRCSVIGPEDYLSEDEINKRLANLDIAPNPRSTTRKPLRKKTEIEELIQSNSRYRAGKSVELKDGNFLRIVSIFRDEKDEIFLSGHLLSRQNSCSPLMPRLRNELVWNVQISQDDFEAGFDAPPSEVPLTEAVRIRSITFTNQKYPESSLKTYKDGGFKNAREEITMGPLFCRWKSTRVMGDRKQRVEDGLVRLTYAEADPNPKARIRPSILRDRWRGIKTILGGSHSATQPSSVNLVSERAGSTYPSEQVQHYTFGDAFCGAGGASSGAAQAGLRVKWGFDKDKDAIRIYADSLGRREGAESLREDVYEFCDRSDIVRFIVDILHISPPCQPFSPAHTIPSEVQDEINRAALFSVWHLIERIKPRIVTIEETEGLVRRHETWFNALINIFTSLDYSVHWKVVRCEDYGVPQQRRRLLIIAAG